VLLNASSSPGSETGALTLTAIKLGGQHPGTMPRMPYPGRPTLEPLPEFKGTATIKQMPEQRARLLAFAAAAYERGRSLREIAELTDRTQAAIRRALDQAGLSRRGPGAPRTRIL
jgi:hypothetical protein